MGFSKGVAGENGGFSRCAVFAPPCVDFGFRIERGRPAVDGKSEGGFGDKSVAADRLERGGDSVGVKFVISRSHPDFPGPFDPDLGGAGDVSGGMEADGEVSEGNLLAVFNGLDVDAGAESEAKNRSGEAVAKVGLVAGAGVV